jgi:uncharacterized membrane protein YqjE
MDADAPAKASLDGNSTSDSVKDWVASLLHYFHLRFQLLGIEGKEAGIHLLIIGGLIVAALGMLAGATLMMGVFILFLICLLFHWDWGWAALLTAVILLLGSAAAAVTLRFVIARPLFPLTFAELEKDREWLKTKTRSVD